MVSPNPDDASLRTLATAAILTLAALSCSSSAPSASEAAASGDAARPTSASSNAPAASSATPTASASASGAASGERKSCPGSKDLTDLGDVSNECHAYAATTKEMLPSDIAPAPCKGGFAPVDKCLEIKPGCHVQGVDFDATAPGGAALVLSTFSGYQVHGVDGTARFAVTASCQMVGLALGEGRFVLGLRAGGTDGDPHFGRVSGVTGTPNTPQTVNLPPPYELPKMVSAKADVIAGVLRPIDGKRESKLSADDLTLLVGDAAIAMPKSRTRIEILKGGSERAPLLTVPEGTTIRDFDVKAKRLAWIEERGGACELVVSPFAEASDKIEPKRLGAVPCGQVTLGPEHVLADTVIVKIADGQRKRVANCEGDRCKEISLLGLTSTSIVVVVTEPKAIQVVPIASFPDAGPAAAAPSAPSP